MSTIIICDVCKKSEDVQTKTFAYSQKYDSMDNDELIETYDLCSKCYSKILNLSIGKYILEISIGGRFSQITNKENCVNNTYRFNYMVLDIIKNLMGSK